MNHDIGIGQGIAFAFSAPAEEQRSHAGRLADAISIHVASQELHRVIDRQAGSDAAAGGIDVEVDVLLGVGHLQKEQLRDNRVGHHIIDGRAQEHDPVHQQARINIIGALAAPCLFDHIRNKTLHKRHVSELCRNLSNSRESVKRSRTQNNTR